jgi:hypothetical protein
MFCGAYRVLVLRRSLLCWRPSLQRARYVADCRTPVLPAYPITSSGCHCVGSGFVGDDPKSTVDMSKRSADELNGGEAEG